VKATAATELGLRPLPLTAVLAKAKPQFLQKSSIFEIHRQLTPMMLERMMC
jgi:hypothetical protein